MGQGQRPVKRRRLSRLPPPLLAFSPFARSILFARSAAPNSTAPDPSPSSKTPEIGIADPKPPKAIKRIESSEDEEEQEVEMVQADFEFFDPRLGDFHGVKLLLQNYLDNKMWDLSGFMDLILEQTTIATILAGILSPGISYGVPRRRLTGHSHFVEDVVLSSDGATALHYTDSGGLPPPPYGFEKPSSLLVLFRLRNPPLFSPPCLSISPAAGFLGENVFPESVEAIVQQSLWRDPRMFCGLECSNSVAQQPELAWVQ